MSVSVPISYLYNRNEKFEVFLRRCLSQEQFERIRGYERCIVCDGKKLNRAFSFYVITDKSIIITENPPQNILLNIPLSSLTHCEIIDDYPDFLDANLTTMSTHVQVRYEEPGLPVDTSTEVSDQTPNVNYAASSVNSRHCENSQQVLENAPEEPCGDENKLSKTKREDTNKNVFLSLISKFQIKLKKPKDDKKDDKKVNQSAKENRKGLALLKPRSNFQFVSQEEAEKRKKSDKKSAKNKDSDECVLDVHFLTNITPMCLLTKISWNNCLISTTLAKEKLYSDLVAEGRKTVAQFDNIQSVLLHFDMLMKQLVTSVDASNLENYATLCAKFINYAHHSYALRRTFWLNGSNVIQLANCAHKFAKEIENCPKVSVATNKFQAAWEKHTHLERLECLVLTIHLLAMFFNETEILKSRSRVLEESKNVVVSLLINIVCDSVALACRQLFVSNKEKLRYRMLHEKTKRIPNDADELYEDLITASSALLYEIIQSGQTLVHHSESAHIYNVRWLVAQFESCPRSSEALLGLTYDAIQSLAVIVPTPTDGRSKQKNESVTVDVQSSRTSKQQPQNNFETININDEINDIHTPQIISPGRAVQTYRQLFIIDIFTHTSTAFLKLIRQKLTEEFKYFVNPETAASKIDQSYPIGQLLFYLLHTVRQRVLVVSPFEGHELSEKRTVDTLNSIIN